MSIFVDKDYINQVSGSLERFRWVSPTVGCCRCPVCGDSRTNPRKARFYFIQFKDIFVVKCHKCGYSGSFGKFLELMFSHYVPEYKLDLFKESSSASVKLKKPEPVKPKIEPVIVLDNSVSIANLPKGHEALKYVLERKIPEDRYDDIGYTENFSQWVSDASGMNKYKRLPTDKRILFELRDSSGKLFGVQGRSIDKNETGLRYITIKFNDEMPKLFGLDLVNTNQPIIVTEGPIDSLFLPNAISICGGDVSMSLERFKGCDLTVVLDNEPRSKDTVHRMEVAIAMGYNVCVWKIDPKFKDANDMLLRGGLSKEAIHEHILKNSYSGAKAIASLMMWKKI